MHSIPPPDLAAPQFKANPFPFFARLRAEAPVYPVTLPDRRRAWLVTRYDDVVTALKDPRFGKDRFNILTAEQLSKLPWTPGFFKPLLHNMLDRDPPDHTRLRALVHKAFTPRVVEQLSERIQSLADDLLSASLQRGRMELVADYAQRVPVTIISELLGVPDVDRSKFQRWANMIALSGSSRNPVRIISAVWMFMQYVRKLIALRRSSPGRDLITTLLLVEEGGARLSDDELLSMVSLLLVAGYEPTVNLITSGTLALLQNPEQLVWLRENSSLMKRAVEELLRYTSPVQLATERYAQEEVTLSGTTIARGDLVLAVLASANRDERQFKAPDTLDLAREPNRHVSFGAGIHYCLGAPLARLQGEISLRTLLHRLPRLRLALPRESLRWRRGIFVRGVEKLPVVI